MRGKISVIIPVFNRSSSIERCIRSVLKQTYQDFEILVVDDASDDDTLNKVEHIHDSRIRIFRNLENRNANNCRNIGIKNASGSYIQFLDSDDVLVQNKFEEQIRILEALPEVDMVFCLSRSANDSSGRLWNVPFYQDYILSFLNDNPLWHTNDPIWRLKSINDYHLFWDEDLLCWQDWHYHLIALIRGCRVLYIPKVLSLFYENSDSNSIKLNNEFIKRKSRILAGSKIYDELRTANKMNRDYRDGLAFHFLISIFCSVKSDRIILFNDAFQTLLKNLRPMDCFKARVAHVCLSFPILNLNIQRKYSLRIIKRLKNQYSKGINVTWKHYV